MKKFQMDDKIIEAYKPVLSGHFNGVIYNKSSLVKLFLSSTFSDTHEERDYLIEHIYPLLREHCNSQYAWDFQVNVMYLYILAEDF